jgi:DNA-binding transcriptional LysR family regulator
MIDDIAAFVAVAEAKSFSEAARRSRQPKSTLSHRMTQLEERLGVRLLQRTTRAVRLTEAGQAFYERCARIVGEIKEAELLAQQQQHAPTGTLKVVTAIEFGMLALGRLIGEFVCRYPAVKVDIELTSRHVDLIEEGFDLAIRIGDLADSSMISRKLFSVARGLYASPRYLEQRGRPSVPADLKQHAFLRFVSPLAPPRFDLHRRGVRATVTTEPVVISNNLTVLRDAAMAGAGIAMLPMFLCHDAVARGELVRVLDEWQLEAVAVSAVYPSKRLLSRKAHAFVEFLHVELSKLGDKAFGQVITTRQAQRRRAGKS